MMLCVVVCMIVGYLFGCFQTGYFVGRINKIDIRDYGSGNSGTTNTLRTLGKTAAIVTFLGDALKGLIAVNLARYVIIPAFGVKSQAVLWLLDITSRFFLSLKAERELQQPVELFLHSTGSLGFFVGLFFL